jgi:hypothetical protein
VAKMKRPSRSGLRGAAAYQRGSRAISQQTDLCLPDLRTRQEAQAEKDFLASEKERVATLEKTLKRCRRALEAERSGREDLRLRLQEANSNYAFAVETLTKAAKRCPTSTLRGLGRRPTRRKARR